MLSKLRFLKFKKFVTRSGFGEFQLTQMSLNIKTFRYLNQRFGSKTVCEIFLTFVFYLNYSVLSTLSK